MSPLHKAPTGSRPSTPASLTIGVTNSATARSPSSNSNSPLKGTAPCFHTTRPQFISSHIERCEACRLKYARQAEIVTIPYSQHAMRRSSAAQQRSRSRQSMGANSRPSSAASIAAPGSAAGSASGAGVVNPSVAAAPMRPSSRAAGASRASEARRASHPVHRRSSSAGSPLLDAKSAARRTAHHVALAREGSSAAADNDPGVAHFPPMPTNLPPAANLYGGMPASPTDTVVSRSRSRISRNATRAQGASSHNSNGSREAREARRASSYSMHAHRRAGNESPVSFIKTAPKASGALPGFPDSGDDEQAVIDLTGALMGTLVDRSRDYDQMKEEYETRIARLQDDIRRMRRQSSRANTMSNESHVPESTNIFDPESAAAKQRALEHAMELDKAALDKFDDFRKSYEECEPSLRTNRAQFAGERPLSPPPSRHWNGAKTPMRQVDLSDHESRRATVNAAEVRRAGEDLMSTPVRRKAQRMLRATSSRRTAKSRLDRPMFSGESDLSDDAADDDEFDDDDDHRDLRNCLMSASKFGTFLVQYVTRQCLDFNTLCDENKMLMVRYDELEKKLAQVEKQSKRLEESRDEQVAQAYEMSAQREMLADKIDIAERSARRLANENDKLKHDLVLSNERCESLDDQITKLTSSLAKARQRYEQELTTLRRSANTLQQDKTVLAKKNDELRVELKGKLQRAGLKANVDEYMAERKKEDAPAADSKSTGAPAGAERSVSSGELDGASAEQEIKRLQESVQFWRKKTDRLNRKLRTEKVNNKEASRMLRVQQEETYRYQQTFGPLPDEVLGDNMESLGDYLPGVLGDARRRSSTASTGAPGAESPGTESEDALSDAASGAISGRHSAAGGGKPSAHDSAGSDTTGHLDHDSLLHDESKLARPMSSSGESSTGEVDEDADDRDIRRYEQRIKNRRAILTTPRSRRPVPTKAATTVGTRRTMASLLSGDAHQGSHAGGESLGDILGTGATWGEPVSGKQQLMNTKPSTGGDATPKNSEGLMSLASELGGLGDMSGFQQEVLRSPSTGISPVSKNRRFKNARTSATPFSDELGGFGIGFDASVSLAEQLAASAKPKQVEKPKMVDASTSTDPLPTRTDAQTATLLSAGTNAETSVQVSLSPPSADAVIATAATGPDAVRSIGVEPQTSMASLVEGGTQTEAAQTRELGAQAVAAFVDQQCLTDPRIGAKDRAVGTVPSTADNSVQAGLASASVGIATDISAAGASNKCVGNTTETGVHMIQVAPETASSGMATDRLMGAVDAGTSVDIAHRDQGCQAAAGLTDTAVDADPLFNTTDQSVEAAAALCERGVFAGAGSTCDSAVATISPALVDRGAATAPRATNDTGASTEALSTCDVHVSTDDSMLAAWLAPLIPAGIAASTVFAALSRTGEPVHELHARQVAEAARSAATAEHERAAALAAERAAVNAKTFVDRAVSPEVSTSDQAVQAEPKQVSKSQQAGSLATADVGIDAQAGPSLASVAVGTEHASVDRWTDPSDPVAKLSKAVDAVATTAERAASQDVRYTSVSTGPSAKSADASVSVCADAKDHATATEAQAKDAGVGPTAEHRECLVEAGLAGTRSFGVYTAVAVAEKAEGPSCGMADRAVGSVSESRDQSVEAGVGKTRAVGVGTAVSIADKAEGPVQMTSSQGVGVDGEEMRSDACVGPDSLGTAQAVVSAGATTDEATVSTHDSIPAARGIETAVATTVDAHVQAEPEQTDASVFAALTTASTSAGVLSRPGKTVHSDTAAATACDASVATLPIEGSRMYDAAVAGNSAHTERATRSERSWAHTVHGGHQVGATQTDAAAAAATRRTKTTDSSTHTSSIATPSAGVAAEAFADAPSSLGYYEHVAYPHSGNASSNEDAKVRAISSLDSIGDANAKAPSVVANYDAPASHHAHSTLGHAQAASGEVAAGTRRKSSAVRERSAVYSGTAQFSSKPFAAERPKNVSDSDDYGYIMVSPRTNVQHMAVPAAASSRESLPETPTKGMHEALAMLDVPGRYTANNKQTAEPEDANAKELGRDLEDDSIESRSPNRYGNARIRSPSVRLQDQRMSVNIGVETGPQQTYYARQPEPLIVQSIARTMVGAYMWKYTPTRFTHTGGRERRHLRYFWIHPYAKMLNWSKQPPSGGTGLSRSSRVSGSRSVYMRAIRIVADQHSSKDGSEPGYSIIITTDHREVKIKATSQADHDLWYMAMSYLQSRRIITSTTYPSASIASGDHGEYHSDTSIASRATSAGSVGSGSRVVGSADGRRADAERSNSKARVHSQDIASRFPLPPSAAATPAGTSRGAPAGRGEFPPPHPGVSGTQGSAVFSHTSQASYVSHASSNNESLASYGTSAHSTQQRGFKNAPNGSANSLLTTPKSMRPVSMIPNTTPGSTEQKRLSLGMFRKGGAGGSGSLLMKQGSHTSDEVGGLPVMRHGAEGGVAQPQSIAAALSNPPASSSKRTPSGSRAVRKMFSGSILRVLRSRDPTDDEAVGPM